MNIKKSLRYGLALLPAGAALFSAGGPARAAAQTQTT